MNRSKSLATVIAVCLCLFAGTNTSAQYKDPKTTRKEKEPLKSSIAAYEKYMEANSEAQLKEFMELVSIPSISSIQANKADVEKAASWIVNKLKAIGMTDARTIPTAGNPVVYGAWDKAPGKPTVLIYAHYDVQPVTESEWDNPPFSPKVSEGKILGRGTSDDKSGVMISIWALEAMLRTDGSLPVNVKFMFDGEEETGSPNFRKFLEENKELVKADFALNADGSQFGETMPSVLMNLRGAATLEFSVKTANMDAHSGQFGGKTPNAALIVSQIIASFYTREGNVAVEGFYKNVLPPSSEERAMMQNIPYDIKADRNLLGTTAEWGDTAYSPLERVWFRPTLEIVGLRSGYIAAEGHSNIVPGSAMARITFRLVNNQNGDEIKQLVMEHIKRNCPPGAAVSFKYNAGYARPMKFPHDTKAYRYVADALQYTYGKPPIQFATGGTIGPLIIIREVLGLYAYSLGVQLADEKWHGANEFLRVSSLRKGQLMYCYYLQHLAEEESRKK